MSYALRLENLSKTFGAKKYRRTLYGILKASLSDFNDLAEAPYALKDINLDVRDRDRIGLIGNNGAGKTTLLKVIAGLHRPSRGVVKVNGRLSLLAGLGIGMIDELSVRENIFFYGTVYGLDRDKIRKKLDEIIQWAELEDFVDAELRTLSLGMRSRLGFSTARHIETDIFLWDEALSAGDANFRQKCQTFFQEQKNAKITYVVATHSLEFVENFCNKALWLQKGQQMAFGETSEVLMQYRLAK